MPIPYSFYSEIQKESTVWEVESRCKRYKDVEIIDGAVYEDHI